MKRLRKVRENYLITQLVKGVPLEDIAPRREGKLERELYQIIRRAEAATEDYLYKRRLPG